MGNPPKAQSGARSPHTHQTAKGPASKAPAPQQSPPKRAPAKDYETPKWATNYNDVIGYTYKAEIDETKVDLMRSDAQKIIQSRNWHLPRQTPSVYFKRGHATLQHSKTWNLGWTKSDQWVWLYFGNVPTKDCKHYDDHKAFYAAKMMGENGSYCWGDGQNTEWNVKVNPQRKGWKSNSAVRGQGELLEIWLKKQRADFFTVQARESLDVDMSSHPSENFFCWVSDSGLKIALHALATEWIEQLYQVRGSEIGWY